MEPSGQHFTLMDLPLDVFEVIAGYLSVRDILACTACSHGMREIFNDDPIWRPRCDKQLCEYLEVTPCKVRYILILIHNMHKSSVSLRVGGMYFMDGRLAVSHINKVLVHQIVIMCIVALANTIHLCLLYMNNECSHKT
jgi:hypothetical protein